MINVKLMEIRFLITRNALMEVLFTHQTFCAVESLYKKQKGLLYPLDSFFFLEHMCVKWCSAWERCWVELGPISVRRLIVKVKPQKMIDVRPGNPVSLSGGRNV